MATSQPTASWEPWIASLQFCPGNESERGVSLSSRMSGMRGPSTSAEWWPQIVGQPTENLGNILLVDSLPAVVRLNVHVIAYGRGDVPLHICLFADSDATERLLENEGAIRFDPPRDGDFPNAAGVQLALPRCQIREAGLYWLVATMGGDSAMRLPLWVNTRALWRGNADDAATIEHLKRLGIWNE